MCVHLCACVYAYVYAFMLRICMHAYTHICVYACMHGRVPIIWISLLPESVCFVAVRDCKRMTKQAASL